MNDDPTAPGSPLGRDATRPPDAVDELETREWIESLQEVLQRRGPDRVADLLHALEETAYAEGVRIPFSANTPYVNTIPVGKQPRYPGPREIERRIKSYVRWNAMAMVVRANREAEGIGGHISTYASAATLLEVGFNHFFRGPDGDGSGDQVFFQGHASPGLYARAFLEGRLEARDLESFRRELRPGGGLSSYPHPWLMPRFWQFPTVSMGLASILAIYQARFNRYLEDRGLIDTSGSRVWCFMGDGETDEPESLGAITLASREHLDNLVFVINCNLQRLDGPVRGNGKIIQELEAAFRGAGWNVIKVIWGSDWDPLLDRDHGGDLVRRMGAVVDGQYQKYSVEDGAYTREHFFDSPALRKLAAPLTDEQIRKMLRGGHDPAKVHAAFRSAVEHTGSPTVILAKTVKGYGLGEAGEGRNVTHQQKKLNEAELRTFRTRFGIPLSDAEVADAPFYKPPEDSVEMRYLRERRQALGGGLPSRRERAEPIEAPADEVFAEFLEGTGDRPVSTTMAFVRLLSRLLKDPAIGDLIVPIVPDEARTFGMEALFRQCGIYAHAGQLYTPVDSDSLLYYREARDGQILEEGITEAGSLSSFIAAGTAYSTHGINTIPFFIFYSMFGMQRVGDLVWAGADMRCRGFLVGATAGRTTLQGEGLQHQDGHSHLLAQPVPTLLTYDPAYAYELALIVQDGIRRMYVEQEPVFYYLTVENEPYPQAAMPEGVAEGVLKGLYRVRPSERPDAPLRAQLLGSGPLLQEALAAQRLLEDRFHVAADVWSVTSWKELRREALEVERWNRLHPEAEARVPYVTRCLADAPGALVAVTDYVKALPDSVARWMPRPLVSLGTDGFGRSETRRALRDFFEVDARYVAVAALAGLQREGRVGADAVASAIRDLDIDPEKLDPACS